MNYWYLSFVPHVADRPNWVLNHKWTLYLKDLEERVLPGDIVFVGNNESGIFAWGVVLSAKAKRNDEDSRVEITRGNIQQFLIDPERLAEIEGLSELLQTPERPFTFLTKHQARVLNARLSDPKPPEPRGNHFILNSSVLLDEDLDVEFKYVTVSQIPKECYEFAVAYSCGEGGHTYFGIKDNGTVVGTCLGFSARNDLRKRIEDKLFTIVPPILAFKDYTLSFENVIDSGGHEIQDLFVIDFEVKPTGVDHSTAGGRTFHKGYSGRRKI